jgi:hypothetical protein
MRPIAVHDVRQEIGGELGKAVQDDGLTTRLATMSNATVTRLAAMRQARAWQRRRSRTYSVNPVMTPTMPVGMRNQRYRMVTAMNAPLPRPSRITPSGSRQHREDNAAPTHAVTPAVTGPSLIASSAGAPVERDRERVLNLLHGECPVVEGESVGSTAARDHFSGFGILRQRHDVIAVRTAHAVSQCRGPATAVFSNTDRMPGAVRALHQIS